MNAGDMEAMCEVMDQQFSVVKLMSKVDTNYLESFQTSLCP